MAVTHNNAAMSKMTHNGTAVKNWSHNGANVYKAEKVFGNITVPDVLNYRVWGRTESQEVTIGDMRGFGKLEFSWSFTTYSGCVNPGMFDSTSALELVYGDGTVAAIGSKRDGLSRSTDTYSASGSFTANISGKSATALANVKVRAKISDMSAPAPLDSDNCTMRANLTNVRCVY